MRQADVKVGGRYLVRVAGRKNLDVVRINDSRKNAGRPTRFTGICERTGRPLGWFTSARLRGPAQRVGSLSEAPRNDQPVVGGLGNPAPDRSASGVLGSLGAAEMNAQAEAEAAMAGDPDLAGTVEPPGLLGVVERGPLQLLREAVAELERLGREEGDVRDYATKVLVVLKKTGQELAYFYEN